MTDEPTGAAPTDPGQPQSDRDAPKKPRRKSRDEVLRHELNVYQAELETQNEELRATQIALEASRARYEDLYARAPVGLVTVGLQSKILSYNDRAARMLRLSTYSTGQRRFAEFMSPESFVTYERHRAQLFKTKGDTTIELQMRREGGSPFWAELFMNLAREEKDGALVCQIALTDI
jgi:PAS domain S-box-containing protein